MLGNFGKYFGSYLSGLAVIVAALPIILTNFAGFPFPRGDFSKIFGFMSTVSNYLIIGMAIFYLNALRVLVKSRKRNFKTILLNGTPVALFTLFILSSLFYISNHDYFIRGVFITDGFVLNLYNFVCLIALTFMFIGPIVALALMGAKHVIEREQP